MLKNKLYIIIIIVILTLINLPIIYSATDEGYGEANDNLGQFTDSFENANNVSIMVGLINNQTLECIELNVSGSGWGSYENYGLFTEVDNENDRITFVSDYHVEALLYRGEDVRLYRDYGLGYFDDCFHRLDVYIDSSGYNGKAIPWFLSNHSDNWWNQYMDDRTYISMMLDYDGSYRLVITEVVLGVDSNQVYSGLSVDTWYYLTVNITGLVYQVKIYTDVNRMNLIGTLTESLEDDYAFRYMLISSFDYLGPIAIDVEIKNLDFGEGTVFMDDGYFITEDYLNYTTGNSLALLTNASIPDGTTMTVQFSNDNETWVDNEGNIGSTSILDGFNAIDLRELNYTDDYKMVNFTGNPTLTPRLYQLREITTNGTAGDGVSTPLEDYAGLLIVGLIIGLIIGIGTLRS